MFEALKKHRIDQHGFRGGGGKAQFVFFRSWHITLLVLLDLQAKQLLKVAEYCVLKIMRQTLYQAPKPLVLLEVIMSVDNLIFISRVLKIIAFILGARSGR